MRIIQVKENQKEIWNKFIAENCSESFLQAWEWGGFQDSLRRKVWRAGIIDDGLSDKDETSKSQIQNSKLIATALIVKYNLPFGKSYLYCPRGPVINESRIMNYKSRIFNMLFNEIKKIAKEEKSLFLKIDPPVEVNHKSRIMNHKYFSKFKKSPNEVQPRNTLILDITKSEEELLKEMKQKTRYNIRLAERKELKIMNYESGITNQECFKEKFEEFWELVEETSKRDKFKSHNKNYYWKILQRIQAKLYLAEYNHKIIASNIVLYFGDYCVYLHGASSNRHRNVMAPYLLQWRQILDAKKIGFKKYDFWGIAMSQKFIKSKVHKVKNDWQGITRFKKGFGGYEKNYVGAYDLVFNSIGYAIYKFARKVRNLM